MPKDKPKYTPRGYQTYILERIDGSNGANLLLELDCGLGKRFITHQLVAVRYPQSRILIIVHSSSSLAETIDYLRGEYGGLERDLGEVSSRIPSKMRQKVLREKRVVVTTPQVLERMIEADPSAVDPIDMVVINEVDTLIRRTVDAVTLVYPWARLLPQLEKKRIIGMSGTLRDDHAVFTGEQLEIRQELSTLMNHIQNAVLISMEDIYGKTDVEEYLEPTFLTVCRVEDRKIRSIALVLDELVRTTRQEITNELAEDGNLDLIQGDQRKVHIMLDRLPVSDELKARYAGVLMLRKYVYGMPPKAFVRMFYADHIKHYFDVDQLRRSLPEVSAKAIEVLTIAKEHDKTVVLTSYLEMVEQIREILERSGLEVLTLTGQSHQKGEVLRSFREDDQKRVLVMSPVGERDLDIPQANVMAVCDVVNTTKTMYQKFKRTRGGEVILLAYAGTSEERKVKRLMDSILRKYPWSTATVSIEPANSS